MTENVLSRIGVYGFAWGMKPPTAEDAVRVVDAADRLGFDSVHLPWHFTLSEKSFAWGNRRVVDPLALIANWVGRTERVRVSLDPWAPSLLHPFFWAQFLSSLHYLSGGRTMTGVREAWWHEDYTVALTPREGAEERFDQALDIITRLWAGETLDPATAPAWDLGDLRLDPAPETPIPLWINGRDSEDIRRAARWGDVLRPLFAKVEEVTHLREKLSEATSATGRSVALADSTICAVVLPGDSPSWIEAEINGPLERRLHGREVGDSLIIGSPQECADRITALAEAGIDYFLFDTQFHGWQTTQFSVEQLERFAEHVVPLIKWPR